MAVSGASPYCSAARLFGLKDWRVVADWAADRSGPRATRASLIDPTDPAGATVVSALKAASGEVEAAALKGGRYTAADLTGLTGNTKADLETLVGWLAIGILAGRRSTGGDELPEVRAARTRLESLRAGDTIFGTDGAVAAGNIAVVPYDQPPAAGRVVGEARRFFGGRTRFQGG